MIHPRNVRSLLLIVLIAGFVIAVSTVGRSNAVLHFADLGGIAEWRPDGSDALLIEGRNGQWYRATFLNDCPEINFSQRLGFVTDASGDLTQFGSILAGDNRCHFDTLMRTPAPE